MKTYTTEQVFRLLKKHPTWKFSAPDSDDWIAMTAHMPFYSNEPCIVYLEKVQRCIGGIHRFDWVRTNKPKPIRVGRKISGMSAFCASFIRDGEDFVDQTHFSEAIRIDSTKTYKVYLVECD